MASSLSSHQQNKESNAFSCIEPVGKRRKISESSRLFDVFINHRGPDVKQTLATELYNSLGQLGIEAFLDSQEKELGKSFPSTIETAIRSAKVHIAIFSERYAESPWCLAELVLMLQCKAKIIPVFYEVEPSELRHIEKGVYANAFMGYVEKGRYLEKLEEWKEALQTVSFLAGVEFRSWRDYKSIVEAVKKEVQRKQCLQVAKYPVGLNNLVEDFEKRCLDEIVKDFEDQCGLEERKNKSSIVGIFGMGGVGKTTLAKELFNRKHSDYSEASFLFDVREAYAKGELPRLQSQVVKDLFDKETSFRSVEEGTSYLKDHLQRSPSLNFLIVVDDIDHVEQLDALLIMDILNKSGSSLVIVTTRDVGVVVSAGITVGYPLTGMDRNNGRQLYCWHAFDKPFPCDGFEVLVDQFVDVCGGLPLSLLVLGRLVHGRDRKLWESNLIKAKKALPRDIKQRLRISFDVLDDEEKQVFMDIACFFSGKQKCMVEEILEVSGWGAQTALQTLRDKCLIKEINDYMGTVLRMHDHLRDLGREMALELSPPRRLWRPQDLQFLELMGWQNVLAKTNTRCFHSVVDYSIGCRATFFLGQSDSCVETSASLLWLKLERYNYETQSPSLHACIPLQHLQRLKIFGGSFKTLWENHTEIFSYQHQLSTSYRDLQRVSGSDIPIKLRELVIRDLDKLKEVPSLSRLNCMEKIEIGHCHKVQNITLPTTFISLFVYSCWHLQRVSGSGDIMKLTNLIIKDCRELEELPTFSRLSCAVNIRIDNCEKLQNIMLPPTLTTLCIEECRDLQRVVGSSELIKLSNLILSRCPKLEELPSLSRVSCMEQIQIAYCEKLQIITLPTTFINLSVQNCRDLQSTRVGELRISYCPKPEELPSLSNIKIHSCQKLQNITLPTAIISLCVQSCRDLERIVGYGDLTKLTELIISECPKLEELPNFSRLSCMKKIQIDNCEKLQNITLPPTLTLCIEKCRDLQRVVGSIELIELTKLIICECPKLEELPSLSRVSCMKKIHIAFCEKLLSITVPTALTSLFLHKCRDLQRVVGLGSLTNLIIRECPEFELSSLSRLKCVDNIEIKQCEKLQNITLPTTFINLSVQSCRDLQRITVGELSNCPDPKELASLSRLGCPEKIKIHSCEKLQYITLPTTIISLCAQSCKDLKRIVGYGDLTKLTELIISECLELEELPNFSRLSCMEKIQIDNCEKLQNITLPPTLTTLCIEKCRDLQRVVGSIELIQLTELIICECPKLEELPSLSRVSCMEKIQIAYCEKLLSITVPTALTSLFVHKCRNLQRVVGFGDLFNLVIWECPEFELSSLSRLRCVENIEIKQCEKLQIITLPTTFINISVGSCRDLQRITVGELSNCPEPEELPCFSRLSCLEKIKIYSCEKLQNITLPSTIKSLCAQRCRDLTRIVGYGDLTKLTELIVSECPEIEELPNFSRLCCMEKIQIDNCEKLQNIKLPPTLTTLCIEKCRDLQRVVGFGDLINLIIWECPEFQLSSLSRLRCVENVKIKQCKKLQIITLPTTCINLSIESCRDLQSITVGELSNCPEPEELPSLSTLSCLEKIKIDSCEKLQDITLPTTIISLCVQSCRDLKRALGYGDLTKLTKLIISECPELEELPSLSRLSCMEKIAIASCKKLEKIPGIEELRVLELLQLSSCSNTAILNCIQNLKSAPRRMCMIGKAVDRAESSLNEYLLSDAHIGADAFTEMVTRNSGENSGAVDIKECWKKWEVTSAAVIGCFLVVVDNSNSGKRINDCLQLCTEMRQRAISDLYKDNTSSWPTLCEGEHIITMVASDNLRHDADHDNAKYVLSWKRSMKKGFRVEVKKGEEWKWSVLRTILDRLHQ